MWDKLFLETNYLQKGINASWARNEVIMNNIANIDTPGFKRSEIEFEDLFESSLKAGRSKLDMTTTNSAHISNLIESTDVTHIQAQDDDTSIRYDENNVSIETEMAALAKNSLEYYTLISKINAEFTKLNLAITGGQ